MKLEVRAVKVFANRFVKTLRFVIEEVAAKIWLRAKLFPVRFVTVVLARVDEPVFTKFCEVRFPDTVVDPVFREVRFPA